MTAQPYSFSFLQYHHEQLSGEFANVGVLLWAPRSQFLAFEATKRCARLASFFGPFEAEDYKPLVGRLKNRFRLLSTEISEGHFFLPSEKRPQSAREIALSILPHDSAALQWSPSGGGLTTNPRAELDELFNRYVLKSLIKEEAKGRDERTVFREVYARAFQSPVVSKHLTEHRVETPLAEHTFRHAWKNGVWNVYETLSFDLVKAEQIKAKAHRWESMTRYLQEKGDVSITYLLGAPEGRNRDAYKTAKELLLRSSAHLVEENEVEDFSRQLESLVASSDH